MMREEKGTNDRLSYFLVDKSTNNKHNPASTILHQTKNKLVLSGLVLLCATRVIVICFYYLPANAAL